MKTILPFLLLAGITFNTASAQNPYFPPLTGDAWDTVAPASLGWCEEEIAPLYDYLEANNTRAFILLKDGKIAMEKYFGSFTKDSAWYWASAGKTLTAFTIGIAQEEGLLSIDDTTATYLGDGWTSCTPAQEKMITIRHQLTMTTGLDDGTVNRDCTDPSCLKYKADPGTRWAYHNAPYTLLDEVIQSASGKTLNNYVAQKIGVYTGITGAFFKIDDNNVFFSKPRSMARFGLLLLNKGNWDGNAVLDDTAYFNQMTNTSQNLNKSYGYLCWLNGKSSFMVPTLQLVFPGSLNPHAPEDMIAALGKNGQVINVVPSQGLVYIRMGDAPGAGEVPVTFNDTVWMKLNSVICNSSAVIPTTPSPVLLYPNPASSTFTMEIPNQEFHLEVFDVSGRSVYTQKKVLHKTNVDCSLWDAGIYFLKSRTNEGAYYCQKLLIGTLDEN